MKAGCVLSCQPVFHGMAIMISTGCMVSCQLVFDGMDSHDITCVRGKLFTDSWFWDHRAFQEELS